MGSCKKILGSQNKLAFCAFKFFFTIICNENQKLEKVKCRTSLLRHKVWWRDQKMSCVAQSREQKETKIKKLRSLHPRLIFINECEKIKLFNYLDKVAV